VIFNHYNQTGGHTLEVSLNWMKPNGPKHGAFVEASDFSIAAAGRCLLLLFLFHGKTSATLENLLSGRETQEEAKGLVS
jgi:hypothetical protein